jgi:hypothetical protein
MAESLALTVEKIKDLISQQGLSYDERSKTLHTTCPTCGRSDKQSIRKYDGATICYRGKCDFGRQDFVHWLALTAKISVEDAKALIYTKKPKTVFEEVKFEEDGRIIMNGMEKERTPVPWPPENTVSLTFDSDGSNYLKNRGIPPEIAAIYNIRYNITTRRVIFPIFEGDKCYGYQGRAVDKVDKSDKVKSNYGFDRSNLVMFSDKLIANSHVIICEGPIDALKFQLVGNFVATMGKVVTNNQIDVIMKSAPKKIYLGLDDDAFSETNGLIKKLKKMGLKVYLLEVPESCKERCNGSDKKADFGECTFEEARQAFENAKEVDSYHIQFRI